MSLLTLNLSLNGMITEVGKLMSFPFKVTLTSFQSFSNTSQIQFFFNLMHSGVSSLPLILNKCMLPAILHRFTRTYDYVSNMNSITLVILESRCPLNELDFWLCLWQRIICLRKLIATWLTYTIAYYKYDTHLGILGMLPQFLWDTVRQC